MRAMMFFYRPILALCAAWPLLAAAQAQDPAPSSALLPKPRQSSHVSEEQAMQWFNLLDANHDGCISRDEARAAMLLVPRLAKDFNEADTNHDGCITPDEIRALSERRRAERQAKRAAEAQQKAASQAAQEAALPDAPEHAPASAAQ